MPFVSARQATCPARRITNHAQAEDQCKHQADEADEGEGVVVVGLVRFVEGNEAQEDDADENGAQDLHRGSGGHEHNWWASGTIKC